MSQRRGYGPGPAEISMSAELPYSAGDYDMLGQDPNVLLAGLDPTQLASSGADFSGVDLSGFDLDVLGLDPTFFPSLDPSVMSGLDPSILDAIPVDGIGDIAGNVADVVADTGSSFMDVLLDVLSVF